MHRKVTSNVSERTARSMRPTSSSQTYATDSAPISRSICSRCRNGTKRGSASSCRSRPVAGILAQTPAGALIDATRAKRGRDDSSAAIWSRRVDLLPWLPTFWPVAVSQATAHAAGAVFGPALAAVTLGIFGHKGLPNGSVATKMFNHAGNACAATAAGIAAYFWGPTVVFYLLAAMSIASLVSMTAIPGRAIDHDLARGLHDRRGRAKKEKADRLPDSPCFSPADPC